MTDTDDFDADDLSFAECLDTGRGFDFPDPESKNVIVVVGGEKTGVYVEIPDTSDRAPEGTMKRVQISNFVPWNAVTHEAATISKDGKVRVTSETKFYPEIITRRGRYRAQFPMDDNTAFDVRKLRAKLHRAGIALPSSANDRQVLENLLSTLGAHDGSRDQRIAFEAMGWALVDRAWTYVAPAGGVNADGIVDTAVTSPGNEDDDPDALPAAFGELGFDRVLDRKELRKAAKAIPAIISLMSEGHSAPYLVIAAALTAPLPHQAQCTVNLIGRTQSGKTNAAKLGLGFFSAAREVTADLTSKPTLIGLQARAVWSRFGLNLWDDFRQADAGTDPEMRKNASSLIQMHLTATDSPRSNKGRGIGKSHPVRSFGILTSEDIVDGGEGVVNRLIVSHVAKGDVKLSPRNDAPYDHYVRDFERSGKVRALMATYIQWLAKRIEDAGSLRDFQDEVKDRRDALLSEVANSRTITSAAMLLAGWDYFFEFAKEKGFDDILPEWDSIEAAMLSGASAADVAATDANPARRIIEATREKIAARAATVTAEYGKQPDGWEVLGWVDDRNNIRPASRDEVGQITPDGEWIAISGNWITDLSRTLGITAGGDTLRALFLELDIVHPDSAKPKPSGFGFNGRPRGIYVKAAALAPALDDPEFRKGRTADRKRSN